jgi:hypothetical protein
MASTSLTGVPMDSTTSRTRRRAGAAITSALAAATVLAALVVAPATPASAAPRPPADPSGAYLFRNGRFTPWAVAPAPRPQPTSTSTTAGRWSAPTSMPRARRAPSSRTRAAG